MFDRWSQRPCIAISPSQSVERRGKVLLKLKKAFDNRLYIELQRHGWREEEQIEEQLLDLAYKHDIPLLRPMIVILLIVNACSARCAALIAEGRYVSGDNRRKVTSEHYLKSSDEMIALFDDLQRQLKTQLKSRNDVLSP